MISVYSDTITTLFQLKIFKETRNMRKYIKILLLTILTCVLLSFPTYAKKPNYKKIYGKVLKQKAISIMEYGRYYTYGPLQYFTLIDIDKNGKKELIATVDSFGGNRMYCIYTIKGKKAKLIQSSEAWFSDNSIEYNKTKKCIILHQHGGTGLSGREVYKIKKGKIVSVTAMQEYHTFENNKYVVYYSKYVPKGKYGGLFHCSKAEYYKLYNKYCRNSTNSKP